MAIAQTAISLCNRRVTSVGLYYSVCGIDGIYYRHDAALAATGARENTATADSALVGAVDTVFCGFLGASKQPTNET